MRILVVDNDAEVLLITKLNFELDGHEFLSASDSATALYLARTCSPDVVLLDGLFRPRDFRLLAQVTAETGAQFVLLTADARETHLLEGLRAGAISFVTKPFDPRELVARITALSCMDSSESALTRTKTIADLEERLPTPGKMSRRSR